MNQRTSNIIGIIAALVIVGAFCTGVIGAFYTDDWRWLLLALISSFFLAAG